MTLALPSRRYKTSKERQSFFFTELFFSFLGLISILSLEVIFRPLGVVKSKRVVVLKGTLFISSHIYT